MKRVSILCITLFSLFYATSARAQEKFTIVIKEPGEGESSHVDSKQSMSMKNTTTIEKQKSPVVQEMAATKHYIFDQTILERTKGASLPNKVRRQYEKAVNDGSGAFVKESGPLPFHGKTVLIEKKADKFEFRLQDGKILDTGIHDLQAEFDRNEGDQTKKAIMPPHPVSLNETWKFDPPKDVGGLQGKGEDVIKVLKAEGTAKLVKVYKKDGRLFGVIDAVMETHMSMSIKSGGAKQDGISESEVLFKLTFEGCIDGALTEGKLSGSGTINTKATIHVEKIGTVTSTGMSVATVENSWQELSKK